ncbi:MAG: hypothetical protein NVS4B7_08350 [Ktedonobacteraceae bacterium]
MVSDQSHRMMGQSVGAKLRAARRAKRYTQSQLAAPDFSISYISAIERGQIHPSLRALEIFARRLGLSSTDFLAEHMQNQMEVKVSSGTSSNKAETAALTLVEAEVYILQGAPLQAIEILDSLAYTSLEQFQKTHYRYLLGWAYLSTDQLHQCVLALDEAKRLAIEQKDTYNNLRTHNLLGLVYAAMHNHQRALQAHQSCLTLLENAQPYDPFFVCHVYNHLGQHYTYLDNLSSAIEMFKQALAVAEKVNEPEYLQSMYWNITQHYAQANNYRLMGLYAHKYAHFHHHHRSKALRSEIYHYLGQALMRQDQEQARIYLEEALQREIRRDDWLTQASITARLAEWFLMHNELQEAEKQAQRAFALAKSAGATLIAVETQLLLGRIYYGQAKYDEGDACFVTGLQMLEQMKMHDELSDQSAFYAQLLDERNKPREAITYYKRAFESRRRRDRYN